MRTGHMHLNRHWWKIGSRESPEWDECGEDKTVGHSMAECSRFDRQRKEMEREMGSNRMTMSYLLGTAKGVKALVRYVIDTDRWNSFLIGIGKRQAEE